MFNQTDFSQRIILLLRGNCTALVFHFNFVPLIFQIFERYLQEHFFSNIQNIQNQATWYHTEVTSALSIFLSFIHLLHWQSKFTNISNFGVLNLSLGELDRTCSNFDNKLVSLVSNYCKYCFSGRWLKNVESFSFERGRAVSVLRRSKFWGNFRLTKDLGDHQPSRKQSFWSFKDKWGHHRADKVFYHSTEGIKLKWVHTYFSKNKKHYHE